MKSVQRGVFAAAGATAINQVDPNKTVVHSVSKGSAGTVDASGALAGNWPTGGGGGGGPTFGGGAGTLTCNPTDLTVKLFSAVLTGPTTLTADGPCEYQVVEYY